MTQNDSATDPSAADPRAAADPDPVPIDTTAGGPAAGQFEVYPTQPPTGAASWQQPPRDDRQPPDFSVRPTLTPASPMSDSSPPSPPWSSPASAGSSEVAVPPAAQPGPERHPQPVVLIPIVVLGPVLAVVAGLATRNFLIIAVLLAGILLTWALLARRFLRRRRRT